MLPGSKDIPHDTLRSMIEEITSTCKRGHALQHNLSSPTSVKYHLAHFEHRADRLPEFPRTSGITTVTNTRHSDPVVHTHSSHKVHVPMLFSIMRLSLLGNTRLSIWLDGNIAQLLHVRSVAYSYKRRGGQWNMYLRLPARAEGRR